MAFVLFTIILPIGTVYLLLSASKGFISILLSIAVFIRGRGNSLLNIKRITSDIKLLFISFESTLLKL